MLVKRHIKEDRALEFVCYLYNWFEWPSYDGQRRLGGNVVNHPKLGSPPMDNQHIIKTTRISYFNQEVGIAISRNTVYVLRDKAPNG
jgi:hypothetical protein